MTDRFILALNCAYCNHLNKDINFSQDGDSEFICRKCSKVNYIRVQFKAYKKVEERN
jgi:transposase-like protein